MSSKNRENFGLVKPENRHPEQSEGSKIMEIDSSVTAFPQNDVQSGRHCDTKRTDERSESCESVCLALGATATAAIHRPLSKVILDCFVTNVPRNDVFKKCAFTLAEVLITLGIIGVVAAMTIPTLINNYQVSVWENSLKKTYALLVNGFRRYMATENCSDLICTDLFPSDTTDKAAFNEKMKLFVSKTFSGASYCEAGDVEKCPGREILRLKGNPPILEFRPTNSFILNMKDGVVIRIANGGCTPMNPEHDSKMKYRCAWIIVDINGEKGPNTMGKDVIAFGSLDADVVFYPDTSLEWAKAQNDYNGVSYSAYWRNAANQCGTPNKLLKDETRSVIIGQNCFARIMENGWKMDYLRK